MMVNDLSNTIRDAASNGSLLPNHDVDVNSIVVTIRECNVQHCYRFFQIVCFENFEGADWMIIDLRAWDHLVLLFCCLQCPYHYPLCCVACRTSANRRTRLVLVWHISTVVKASDKVPIVAIDTKQTQINYHKTMWPVSRVRRCSTLKRNFRHC